MGKINKSRILLTAIIFVHILLLLQILFFPYPELMVYSYLTDKGMIPYSQIFDQHFPGIMFFPVNLASIGVNNPQSLRIIHIGLIAINQILIYLVSKKIFKSNKKALMVNFLYLLFQPYYEGYVLWIESFVTPLILASFLVLVDKRKKSIFISGVLLGTALLFKQVVLPLILILGVFLLLNNKQWKYYLLGAGLAASLLLLFVGYYSNLLNFVYWTYTFNVTTFASMGRKLPNLNQLVLSLPILIPPIFLVGKLLVNWIKTKKMDQVNNQHEIMIILFALGTSVFVYARYDYVHLQPLIPFALITLCFLLFNKNRIISFAAAAGVIIGSIYLLPGFYRTQQGRPMPFFGKLEQGLVEASKSYTDADDSVFALATTPHIYYLADRMPPGDVFVFQFPWFMVEVEDEIFEGLKEDPPELVFRDPKASVQGMNLVSYMPEINSYIQQNYREVDNIEGVEIMIRK